jgi:hypothetical protein
LASAEGEKKAAVSAGENAELASAEGEKEAAVSAGENAELASAEGDKRGEVASEGEMMRDEAPQGEKKVVLAEREIECESDVDSSCMSGKL